jgi:IS5 family transposase
MTIMKQGELGLILSSKCSGKWEFLDELNRTVPWAALVKLITPHTPSGTRGWPPFLVEVTLWVHFRRQWFGMNPAKDEALLDMRALTRIRAFGLVGHLVVRGVDHAALRATAGNSLAG